MKERSLMARAMVLALVIFGGFAATAFAGGPTHGWLLPNCITENGDKTDHLWWFIFWIVMVTFVGTEVALCWFMWKYRAQPGRKAYYTHGSHKLEIIWTIIPAIILAIIAMIQMGTWLDIKDPKRMPDPEVDPDVYEVHVLARQFNWNFRYPGADGKFGTKDDFVYDKLVAPANRPVLLRMRSMDVIHSLYLPHMRLKQDVVPGLTIKSWFNARETGKFPIVCAELCGVQHYTMRSDCELYDEVELKAKLAKIFEERGPADYSSLTENFRFWPIETAK